MIEIYIILSLVIGIGIGYFLASQNSSTNDEDIDSIKKEMENTFKALALDVNRSNTEEFFKLANDKFQGLSKESDKNLETKKKLIDENLNEMSKRLKSIEDASIKLNENLESTNSQTKDLTETTIKLREILSSSQKRGQWGERMVEDILSFMGLVEGINFEKQQQIAEGRPDFTFKLPNEKSINMDVKFPLAHYENYVNSDNENDKAQEKIAFIKDVRNHIKTIEKRSYIDPANGTVDYVLMFIPNESLYAFLNQEDKDLIDFSLSKKVLLCSPITLYAVLSLIRQAVSNFAMEQKAGEMQELVGIFRKQWDQFTDKIHAMGKSISALTNHYDELKGPRFRALEKPMDKINELQLGQDVQKKDPQD